MANNGDRGEWMDLNAPYQRGSVWTLDMRRNLIKSLLMGLPVGSIIVGVLVEASSLVIPSDLKYVGALVVLIGILLFRPQGILGRKERVG